jgi:phosphopantetheine binding protein/AMP-binding enzyme
VEPGEIEAVLTRHDQVRAAVVAPRPGPDGDTRLIAWLVPAGTAPTLTSLRGFLLDHLPAAMVPEQLCLLRELPVGAHGKLDRAALPEPGHGDGWLRADGADRIAPRDPVERTLAAIWTDVIGCRDPSVTDDFYELGGHSLLANRIAVRVRAAFGVDVPLSTVVAEHLTIERLATLVQSHYLTDPADPQVSEVLRWLDTLSDDEVAARLTDDRTPPP